MRVRKIDDRFPKALLLLSLFFHMQEGTARAQSALPHFAAGGGFITGFYVFNTGSQPANYSISFHDDSGSPVALSFSGLGTRTIVSDTLPGNGSKYYEADSPSGDLLAGSGTITADPTISIQALFRRQGSGSDFSEAAVPAGLPANEFTIPFDATVFAGNGSQINTGIALANTDSSQAAHILCTARDTQGKVIVNGVSIPDLNPLGHWAGSDFPALLGKRGTLDCISNAKVSSVALRSLGTAMSSMPLIANSATSLPTRSLSLPHFAAGGGFVTGFYILNTGNEGANYSINFHDDAGRPVSLAVAGLGNRSSLSGTIPAKGAAYFEADSPSSALLSGAATITADSTITIQELFRSAGSDGSYNEVAVPATAGSNELVIPFDDTVFAGNATQIYTGLALVNMDPQQSAHLTCTARDGQGTVIPNAIPAADLSPLGHWQGYQFLALAGKRGTLDCTSKTRIGAVALRFVGSVMSSLPVAIPAAASKAYNGTKFSFRYPVNFTIASAGADPDNRGFTLVRLSPTDGSPQKVEVRYSATKPDVLGWPGESQILTGAFVLKQVGGIGPFNSHYLNTEVSGSGSVTTEIDTYKLSSGANINVIGSLVWSRFDVVNISYAYDPAVVSSDARDLILNTLTFTTKPSLLGNWGLQDIGLAFASDSTVDMHLDDPVLINASQYSIKDGLLVFSYLSGGALTPCQYGVDLGHLHLDCGSGRTWTLGTQPD